MPLRSEQMSSGERAEWYHREKSSQLYDERERERERETERGSERE